MKKLSTLALTVLVAACSTNPITKWTSPEMRVAIDPDSLDSANYVRIRQALVESGRFFVVDRQDGFKAVVKEQNIEHRDAPNRFGDREKYARMARLFGVGAVVVGHVECMPRHGLFRGDYLYCEQFLALINAVTAEVISEVKGNDDSGEQFYGTIKIASDWTATVAKLNSAIPRNYEKEHYDARMKMYREEIGEDSIRARELSMQPQAGAK